MCAITGRSGLVVSTCDSGARGPRAETALQAQFLCFFTKINAMHVAQLHWARAAHLQQFLG